VGALDRPPLPDLNRGRDALDGDLGVVSQDLCRRS
jgi:hypothetical protein